MEYCSGLVTKYSRQKLYGFVWDRDKDVECFFHISAWKTTKRPEPGDLVSFHAVHTPKGYQAENILVQETGSKRKPLLVGVTAWVGPKDSGEFGIVNHRGEVDGGTFVHKSNLIDGSLRLIPNCLYRLDTAKARGRHIGLNVGIVNAKEDEVIAKLANDDRGDPRVRLKAIEMQFAAIGKTHEFERKMRAVAKELNVDTKNSNALALRGAPLESQRLCNTMPGTRHYRSEPSLEFEVRPGKIGMKQRGEPGPNTVEIVKTVVVGGVIVTGLATAGWVLNNWLKR